MKTPLFTWLVAVAALSGCSRHGTSSPSALAPIPVRIAASEQSSRAIPLRVTATLHRKSEAELAFKVGGIVESVSVRVGDRVRAGQVLATLRLDEIDAQLTLAHAAQAKARRDYERAQALQAEKVATVENLQDARTALESADAQVRIAEFNRQFSVITAPEDGRILRRTIEPNELVAPGRGVLGFAADREGWIARAGLPDGPARVLRTGDAASLIDPATGLETFSGVVTQLGEAVDPATRTLPVEVQLTDNPEGYRSGSVIVLQLQPGAVAPRATVPASALVEGAGRRAFLFVVKADGVSVERREVTVEALWRGKAYLTASWPEAPRVVVEGAEYLREGALVSIQP